MPNYLRFKKLDCKRQNLDALFLINDFKNKICCCSLMDTVGLRLPTFTVSNVSRLSPSTRRVPAAFSINITSPSRIHFTFLNATELHHYRVTLLPRIKFWTSSSSSHSLAFLCTVSVLLCYRPLAVGKHLNKGT
jgi:hypothetical protein